LRTPSISALRHRRPPAPAPLKPRRASECVAEISTQAMSEELKARGNAAFAAKNYDEAIDFFSQGITLDASNYVLYSNRSACYAGQQVLPPMPLQRACI